MSYIVPNEIPKECSRCPYGYVIYQNPLSSKTPIKRYRCQAVNGAWREFETDYYNDDYKDKDCPLIAYNVDAVVAELEENSYEYTTVSDLGIPTTGRKMYLKDAIEIVRKGGVK